MWPDEHKPECPLPTRRWLKPDEAAAYLGVSVPTLKVLGVKPSRKLGKQSPRYDVHELDQAMADKPIEQEADDDDQFLTRRNGSTTADPTMAHAG